MGRPTQYRQSFWVNGSWGQDFAVEFAYNRAGSLTWQKYPSQRTVTYNYDAAGRLGDYNGQAAFGGNLGDGTQRIYSSEVRYHEFGGMEQERFGTATPVYNKRLFNSRGQRAEIRVSTYAITSAGHETDWNRSAIVNHYSNAANAWGAMGGGSDNNGNLLKQEVHFPADGQLGQAHIVQEYGYDALNRLTAVYDKPFNGAADFYQFYKYDRWGNRTVDPNSWNAPAQQFSVGVGVAASGVSGTLTGGASVTYHSTDEAMAGLQDANRQLAISANAQMENLESPVAGAPDPTKLGEAKDAFGGGPMSASLARLAYSEGLKNLTRRFICVN